MLAFVTGATGFVGSHVARALAAQGADLRLLVRSGSDLRNIQELQAERVMGDLRVAARQLADGDLASASKGMRFGEIAKRISEAKKSTAA